MENNQTDQPHVQLLIDALRSAEFAQGRQVLRRNDHYCCLGVACEIYRRQTGKGKWLSDFESQAFWTGTSVDQIAWLPVDVMNWYGFDSANPRLAVRDTNESAINTHSAVALNDAGASFAEIADAFERTYVKQPA